MKVIITGSTGMVGEGVMHEALIHPDVESVLVINRKSNGIKHKNLKEIIHKDFLNFADIADQIEGYDACFHCMGISSVGKDSEFYKKITYDISINLAKTLIKKNQGMVFNYVSGAGTDGSEKGKSRWAKVKGKTENDLLNLGFKDAYMFRPGYLNPTKGLNNTYTAYKFFAPFYPLIKFLFPSYATTLKELGLAMINSVKKGYEKKVLECKDIVKLSI